MDKYDERRDELAESALKTLGRARATPAPACARSRSNSEFSHGVLHYYFADKTELIIYGVRHYKAECVHPVRRHRRDDVDHAEELRDGFAAKLAETRRRRSPMHRLWYDLRNQSMFDQRSATTSPRSTQARAR